VRRSDKKAHKYISRPVDLLAIYLSLTLLESCTKQNLNPARAVLDPGAGKEPQLLYQK